METWQKPEIFAFGLAMIFIAFLTLLTFIVVFLRLYFKRLIYEQNKQKELSISYQKDLLSKSVITQEKERERLAAELHDGLIPKLSTIAFMISSGDTKVMNEAVQQLSESIDLARKISHELTPPLIERTDLKDLIPEFLFPLEQSFKVEFIQLNYKKIDIDSLKKLHLYRIFQEVINNILKHANASEIKVCLRVTDQRIAFTIQDNGIGFDSDKITPGLGLNNITARSQFLNGTFKFKSKPGSGSTFIFSFNVND
jgi:signal transduction histidine kinase